MYKAIIEIYCEKEETAIKAVNEAYDLLDEMPVMVLANDIEEILEIEDV